MDLKAYFVEKISDFERQCKSEVKKKVRQEFESQGEVSSVDDIQLVVDFDNAPNVAHYSGSMNVSLILPNGDRRSSIKNFSGEISFEGISFTLINVHAPQIY